MGAHVPKLGELSLQIGNPIVAAVLLWSLIGDNGERRHGWETGVWSLWLLPTLSMEIQSLLKLFLQGLDLQTRLLLLIYKLRLKARDGDSAGSSRLRHFRLSGWLRGRLWTDRRMRRSTMLGTGSWRLRIQRGLGLSGGTSSGSSASAGGSPIGSHS